MCGFLKLVDRRIFLFFFLVALGMLGGAFFFQYVMGVAPCQFCLYERWVYAALAFVCFVCFSWRYIPKRYGVFCILFVVCVGVGVTGVHIAIERGLISESLCAVEKISYEEMLESLKDLDDNDERMPSCAKVTFRLLGLSLAECNMICLLFFLVFLLHGVFVRRKNLLC